MYNGAFGIYTVAVSFVYRSLQLPMKTVSSLICFS